MLMCLVCHVPTWLSWTTFPRSPFPVRYPYGRATGRLLCTTWRVAVKRRLSHTCPPGHLSVGSPHWREAAVSAAPPALDSLKILWLLGQVCVLGPWRRAPASAGHPCHGDQRQQVLHWAVPHCGSSFCECRPFPPLNPSACPPCLPWRLQARASKAKDPHKHPYRDGLTSSHNCIRSCSYNRFLTHTHTHTHTFWTWIRSRVYSISIKSHTHKSLWDEFLIFGFHWNHWATRLLDFVLFDWEDL